MPAPIARQVSGIGQGQSSTEEGKAEGRGPRGLPSRAGPPEAPARSRAAEPLAARMPLATLPSHPGSQSLDQSTVGAGRRIHPTRSQFAATETGSVECARAPETRRLSLPSLPNSPLESSPEQSWPAGGSPGWSSCPGAPAPPRPELPGLGAAAQPSANKGGQEAPGAPPILSRPVGSARLRPRRVSGSLLESWPYRLILIHS